MTNSVSIDVSTETLIISKLKKLKNEVFSIQLFIDANKIYNSSFYIE